MEHMFGNLMGAKLHLVARTLAPVMSDTGLAVTPTVTLTRTPKDLDILFVSGGSAGNMFDGLIEQMRAVSRDALR
jgi:cyclohexyl-isocyanide hydratase